MQQDLSIDNSMQINEKSIHQLTRTIGLSDNQFTLIIANSNYSSLKANIIKYICDKFEYHIIELSIPAFERTIFSYIKSKIGSEQPDALIIDNFDKNKKIEQIFLATNQVREEFRKSFHFPVIFWMNDNVLDKFIRLAPDFRSWAGAPIGFKLIDTSLIRILNENADILAQSIIDNNFEQMNVSLDTNLSKPDQLHFFLNDIEKRDILLSIENQADLQFIEGYSKEFYTQCLEALFFYQQSYDFWSAHKENTESDSLSKIFKRQIALKYSIARCFEKTGRIDDAIQYLKDCLSILEDQQIISLPVINLLCMLQKAAKHWEQMEHTALILKKIGHETSNLIIQAKSYLLLAEATLSGDISQKEKTSEELASKALEILSSYQLNSNDDECEYIKLRDHSMFALSRSNIVNEPPNMDRAARLLEKIITEGVYQCDPILYIQSCDELRKIYFLQNKYRDAFIKKKDRQSLEQQYGYKAFIGAGRIKAILKSHGTIPINSDDMHATGRQEFIDEIKERIRRKDKKLIIIHGQSGVGKSSILEADIEPKLTQMNVDNHEVHSVSIRTYNDWKKSLSAKLSKLLSDQSILPPNDSNVLEWIISELHLNTKRHIFVVFIFDQFEEFFIINTESSQRHEFYSFMKDCLNIPYVNIVLSLREDYLHYLLEYDQVVDLEIINNDILSKDIRHPLGNFSKSEAISIIKTLTSHTHFQMEDSLIKKMVNDLADENEEVRPIELQIIGYQMQESDIRTLDQYKEKEELIHNYFTCYSKKNKSKSYSKWHQSEIRIFSSVVWRN
ncbi:repeat-containing protein [Candidatus Magnetomorum sp. HK-1]|nr:repeat-containing protein [Candidatus Magnetomorum sp. HK-1]